MDPTTASTLLAWMDREIWLVTASAGGRRGGLIATHVGRASIVPDLPRVLVGVAKQHQTWELIQASGLSSRAANSSGLNAPGPRSATARPFSSGKGWLWRNPGGGSAGGGGTPSTR